MNSLRTFALALCTLVAGACASKDIGSHINALTGQACEPDDTYMERATPHGHGNDHGGNDQCQGTSNGDNCDDLHSGKIDCIGDGNSGQGDDKKHNCEFPQPGCDENGCCDDDMVDPPPPSDDPPGEDTPPPPDGTDPPPPPDGTDPPPPPPPDDNNPTPPPPDGSTPPPDDGGGGTGFETPVFQPPGTDVIP